MKNIWKLSLFHTCVLSSNVPFGLTEESEVPMQFSPAGTPTGGMRERGASFHSGTSVGHEDFSQSEDKASSHSQETDLLQELIGKLQEFGVEYYRGYPEWVLEKALEIIAEFALLGKVQVCEGTSIDGERIVLYLNQDLKGKQWIDGGPVTKLKDLKIRVQFCSQMVPSFEIKLPWDATGMDLLKKIYPIESVLKDLPNESALKEEKDLIYESALKDLPVGLRKMSYRYPMYYDKPLHTQRLASGDKVVKVYPLVHPSDVRKWRMLLNDPNVQIKGVTSQLERYRAIAEGIYNVARLERPDTNALA